MMQEIIYHHPSILDKTVKTIGKSFLIKYNKQIYFIGIHHGYPISYININKNNFDKDNLNICSWNEILFKNIDYTMDQFVFNKFSKKQINSSNFYYCDTKRLKYKNNHYFPINMLPGNVKNLYYVFYCIEIDKMFVIPYESELMTRRNRKNFFVKFDYCLHL